MDNEKELSASAHSSEEAQEATDDLKIQDGSEKQSSEAERIALIQKEAAEAQERAAKIQAEAAKEAANAQIEAAKIQAENEERVALIQAKSAEREAKEKRKATRTAERIRRKKERKPIWKLFVGLPKMVKTVLSLVILIVVFGGIIGGSLLSNAATPNTTVSKSSLERVVNISKLSGAKFVYNGVAEVENDKGEVEYHIAYKSTIRASIDMSDISFDIDDTNKTVTPILPRITLEEPELEISSIEFFEDNPNLSDKEIIKYCKDDAENEAKATGEIFLTAQKNLRTAINALTNPLLEPKGYSIVWETENSVDTTGERKEGGSSENE